MSPNAINNANGSQESSYNSFLGMLTIFTKLMTKSWFLKLNCFGIDWHSIALNSDTNLRRLFWYSFKNWICLDEFSFFSSWWPVMQWEGVSAILKMTNDKWQMTNSNLFPCKTNAVLMVFHQLFDLVYGFFWHRITFLLCEGFLGDWDCWAATPGCGGAHGEDGGSTMSGFYECIK